MSAKADEVVCPECGQTMMKHSSIAGCPEVSKFGHLDKVPLTVRPLNEHGYPIYLKGTPIEDVREFDRGQKVVMVCKDHPLSVWASKDPYVSRWFAARREYEECDCPLTNYVLAEDYSPTRNG